MGTYVANDNEIIARITPAVNFLADPGQGCWEWTRPANSWGYGETTARGSRKAIHRLVYELFFGPIPDKDEAGEDLVVDHLCRNRICVNPMHLQVITRGENARLGRLRNTHCPSGHPLSGDNVGFTTKGWRFCRTCSRASCKQTRERRKAQSEEF